MPLKCEIVVNDERYLLAHEHKEFDTELPLSDFLVNGVKGYTAVIGHTPTSHIREYMKKMGYSDEGIRGDLCIWDSKCNCKAGDTVSENVTVNETRKQRYGALIYGAVYSREILAVFCSSKLFISLVLKSGKSKIEGLTDSVSSESPLSGS